jgi:asparagine synthase (glutamine-hydrolysing)
MARQGQWRATAREVREVAREQGVAARSVLKEHVIIPLTPASVLRAYARLRGSGRAVAESAAPFSAINPDFAAKLQMSERKHDLIADARRTDSGSALHQRMRLLLGAADAGDVWQAFRARFGVEQRDPTCDVRVVEFCFGIPGTLYMRDGQGRFLVRHSMRDVLPAQVLDRRTRGAQSADWIEWLPGMRRELTEELVRLEHSDVAQRCLDVPRLRRLLMEWPEQFGIEHLEDYALVLLRAMETGRFIRWFEESYG